MSAPRKLFGPRFSTNVYYKCLFALSAFLFSDYNLNLICEDQCYTELVYCAQKCNGDSSCLTNCAREEGHCIQGLIENNLSRIRT